MSQSFLPPYPNTYWVTYGQLLAGEHPSELDDEATSAKLASLMDAGLRTFVDLTLPGETKSYDRLLHALAEKRGIEITFQRVHIPDRSVPPVPTLTGILDAIDRAVRIGRPAFVHCFGGIGRTGTVIGCYLRRHGVAKITI